MIALRYSLLSIALCLGTGCDDKPMQEHSAPEPPVEATSPKTNEERQPSPKPLPANAPLTGTHLDGHNESYKPAQPYGPRKAKGKTVELVLRSTPPGATASIDGKPVGNTPTFWQGTADGRSHEYTFTKSGYAMARYRFVATQSGIVHASLAAIVENNDANELSTDSNRSNP